MLVSKAGLGNEGEWLFYQKLTAKRLINKVLIINSPRVNLSSSVA